jgi:hypothetical protein
MAASQAGRGGKGGVRKVNPNAGKRGYRAVPKSERQSDMDRFRQGASERTKTANRAKSQQKRDAVGRGAEGPKRSVKGPVRGGRKKK